MTGAFLWNILATFLILLIGYPTPGQGAGSITGFVCDRDGRPVSNATVKLTSDTVPPTTVDAVTDAQGSFRAEGLKTGLWTIYTWEAKGYYPQFEYKSDIGVYYPAVRIGANSKSTPQPVINLIMAPNSVIIGRVYRADGTLAVNDTVWMVYPGGGCIPGPEPIQMRTDSAGRLRIEIPYEGNTFFGLYHGTEEFCPMQTFDLSSGKETPAKFRLLQRAFLSGRVVDKDNKPVANVLLDVQNISPENPTEKELDANAFRARIPVSGSLMESIENMGSMAWQITPFTKDDGTFRLEITPGVRFKVTARGREATMVMSWRGESPILRLNPGEHRTGLRIKFHPPDPSP